MLHWGHHRKRWVWYADNISHLTIAPQKSPQLPPSPRAHVLGQLVWILLFIIVYNSKWNFPKMRKIMNNLCYWDHTNSSSTHNLFPLCKYAVMILYIDIRHYFLSITYFLKSHSHSVLTVGISSNHVKKHVPIDSSKPGIFSETVLIKIISI